MQTFLDISDFREIHFSEKKKKKAQLSNRVVNANVHSYAFGYTKYL